MFDDAVKQLSEWIDGAVHALDELEHIGIGTEIDKIRNQIIRHKEFQRSLAGKQSGRY